MRKRWTIPVAVPMLVGALVGTATAGSPARDSRSVAVAAVNAVPVAVDDAVSVSEDASAVFLDVVANDSDADGDILTVTAVGLPSKGVAVVASGSPTGVIYMPRYTSGVDSAGVDSFTYTISDGNGGTATATVTVTVNDPPVAVGSIGDRSMATGLFGHEVVYDVSQYFADINVGDRLSYSVSVPEGTTAITEVGIDGNHDLNVTSSEVIGATTVTVTATDSLNATATQTFTLTVNAVPVAVDDAVSVSEDASAVFLDVVANDSDADGDILTVTAVGLPSKGVAVVASGSPTGVIYMPRYTSGVDSAGVDSFTYTISDGNGGTATATVTVTVNDPPVAVGSIGDRSMATGLFGHEVVYDVSQYFADINVGDRLSYSVSVPEGTTAITEVGIDGNHDLNVTSSEVIGATTVTVTATDSLNATATQTFTLTVTPSGPGIRIFPNSVNEYTFGHPDIAYNSDDDEYLVVFTVGSSVWGQRLDADGNMIGTGFLISDIGRFLDPDVVYNSDDDEYLVVWHGVHDTGPLVESDWEVFGQRLDADGNEIGTNDFRISDTDPDGEKDYGALSADVVYNSDDNEYLVVWHRAHDTGSILVGGEVFGQRLDADGNEIGTNDFRISDTDPDGNTNYYGAWLPDVVYNSDDNEYLVVWSGDNDTGSILVEYEIFGQRLDADGNEIGTNDFRISDMGPDGSGYRTWSADVVYNSDDNEYLVVWSGDDDTGSLVNDEYEIFGQRIDSDGNEIGTNDFRISDMGPDGNTNYSALSPNVVYNSDDNEYLVVWNSRKNRGPIVEGEPEVFGQRLDADGNEIGTNDFRISDTDPDGNYWPYYWPRVVYNSDDNEYMVVWSGLVDPGAIADEMHGRRVQGGG